MTRPLKIAVTGASGFLGSYLCRELEKEGHTILKLVRRPTRRKNEVYWNYGSREVDRKKLEGLDVCIHLAGESLFHWRWTPSKRKRIRESRVSSTAFLSQVLGELRQPPGLFLTASGVGYYGNTSQAVDESGPKGEGFLADLVEAWEQAVATQRAAPSQHSIHQPPTSGAMLPSAASPGFTSAAQSTTGTTSVPGKPESSKQSFRVLHLRSGLVLSRDGGALALMLPSFRWGGGAVMGSGEQWFPWISLRDWAGAVLFLIKTEVEGPVNLTAPNPVTQREFADGLAGAMRRPRFLRVPSWAIRLGMGEMGVETVLSGQKAVPRKLLDSGYAFKDAGLKDCLNSLFGKPYRNG